MVKDLKQKLSDKIEALLSRRKEDWKASQREPQKARESQETRNAPDRNSQTPPKDFPQVFNRGFS